ncbi:MAG TPA: hypothetical protein VN678_13355 [Acidobacteriaceae bacterium]|nr:hypothetical protein [Acidobacteriaceae bacterium]
MAEGTTLLMGLGGGGGSLATMAALPQPASAPASARTEIKRSGALDGSSVNRGDRAISPMARCSDIAGQTWWR